MDLKQIEKMMGAMERNRIKRLALKEEGFEIELERECASSGIPTAMSPVFSKAPTFEESIEGKKVAPTLEQEAMYFVTSPMVGTFYSSPSPDDPPFVKVGDEVREDSVLCIIEAMKVMNEVKAGVRGRVAEILLKSGNPVEFGTKMFRIDVR